MTRRDPRRSRPPAAYRLAWQGDYYQVWGRRPGAPAALAHLGLSVAEPIRCTTVRRLARLAERRDGALVAAASPGLIRISVPRRRAPAWRYRWPGLSMPRPGTLRAAFRVPRAGLWDVWVRGETMPTLQVGLDGHRLAGVGGELSGSSSTSTRRRRCASGSPPAATASRRPRRSSASRRATAATPAAGAAVTPARSRGDETLQIVPNARWRSLCGRRLDWIEVVPASRSVTPRTAHARTTRR